MKKFFALLLSALLLATPVLAADPVTEVNVVKKAATIDGVVSAGEWDEATALTLNVSDTNDWSGDGAGIVGGVIPDGFTDADFCNTVKLMVKDGYLYYLETRQDKTQFFGALDQNKPYTQDGTLIWFYDLNEEDRNSLSILPWNNDAGKTVLIFNDDANEPAGEPIADAESAFTKDANGYTLEAKFPLDAIQLSEEALASGQVLVTYCTVNIIDPEFSGDSADLWGDNYQAQYTGVGAWDMSPVIKLVDAKPVETEAPAADAPAAPAPSAPATADMGIVAAAAVLAIAAGAVLTMKKR